MTRMQSDSIQNNIQSSAYTPSNRIGYLILLRIHRYVKRKSVPSLVAGVTCGVLLGTSSWMIQNGQADRGEHSLRVEWAQLTSIHHIRGFDEAFIDFACRT